MAILNLTLYDVSSYAKNGNSYSPVNQKISLATEMTGVKLYLTSATSSNNKNVTLDYTLNLVNCTFQKKMYQPTEILADLQINRASGDTWDSIGRKTIESMFKHKQVKLEVDGDSIGEDFYVHEVLPCYKKDSIIVKLKIYSLDKLLTLDNTSYSFVAKKLGDNILKDKMANYKIPYDKSKTLNYDTTNMQMLYHVVEKTVPKKDKDGNVIKDSSGKEETETVEENVEHIFPYLVQYNESFHDLLIRTCNRWGEFVYWEDSKLNIGYDSDEKKVIGITGNYKTITFPNIDTTSELVSDNSKYYFPVGADDSTIRDTNVQKSKWYAKAKIFAYGGMGDVYWMQKFSQFFGTNKGFVSFFTSTFLDDLVDYAIEEGAIADKNSNYNEKYFPDSGNKEGTTDEQYGEANFLDYNKDVVTKDGMNEFTEINTTYNDAKYKEILGNELKAMENVVVIDYDTTWPKLKLGDVIKVDGEKYIVVRVICEKNDSSSPVFQVVAIGEINSKFYPPMLPTGHVRYSGPQKATVEEASSADPCDQNRVRVAYPWQLEPKANVTDDDTWVGDLSPRIRIASADGGANLASRFYKGDSVLIGYVDGNIERPYVLGSIPQLGTLLNNVHTMTTPGGHALNLTDGTGEGFVKFISNAFLPLYNTIAGFAPSSISSQVAKGLDSLDGNKYLEGGFTLTDRFGIYTINGSTEKRSVTISSPWGNVLINAFTGITISAPNGDINIAGKNVNITAGNTLSLTSGTNIAGQLKGVTKTDKTLEVLSNVAVAVAEKVAQRFLKVIDLKLVRAAVDIVMKPVEGTLTLKSMRFMKLEAGMRTRCEFPKDAYKKEKQNELKGSALTSMDSLIGVMSVSYQTIIIFKEIKTFANNLLADFERRSKALVEQKKKFDNAIRQLADVAKNPNNAFCNNYANLQDDFWAAGEYQKWTEDKFGFDEGNVGTTPDHIDDVALLNFYGEVPQPGDDYEDKVKNLCNKRTKLRKNILKEANKLRKMICEVLNFDMSASKVLAFFGARLTGVQTAASKAKCPDALIYKFPDNSKNLEHAVTVTNNHKKYLRRLIIYNLLIVLGFNKDTRVKNDNQLVVAEPDTKSFNAHDATSLLNDVFWTNYVNSLSGVPVIKKQKGLLGQLADTVIKSSGASDVISLIKLKERSIWGSGREGRVLIGADGKTFQFKDNTFSEIDPIVPTNKSFQDETEGLKEKDKDFLNGFMTNLKDTIRNS